MKRMKRKLKSKVKSKLVAAPVSPPATEVAPSRPPPIVRNDWEWTRLRTGDVVVLSGRRYIVDYLNPCRARCIPMAKKRVDYETVAGKRVQFDTNYAAMNISPNSDIPILERLGSEWRNKIKIEVEQSESSNEED